MTDQGIRDVYLRRASGPNAPGPGTLRMLLCLLESIGPETKIGEIRELLATTMAGRLEQNERIMLGLDDG
jgi:hypothetical protein